MMRGFRFAAILAFTAMVFSEPAEGPQPVLQRTVAALFTSRGVTPAAAAAPGSGPCRLLRASPQQARMCRREPQLADALAAARGLARASCREAFRYDRWNCTELLNGKQRWSIFAHVYRETAFVHALVAASLAHAVARACAAGQLRRCGCGGSGGGNGAGRRGGCGDDLQHGRRVAVAFLELSGAGSDHIAEVLRRNAAEGARAVTAHAREVCKCHGFSGSCTTRTCWRRVAPFKTTMAALKRQYHRAVRRRMPNRESAAAATRPGGRGRGRGRRRRGGRRLEYVQRGPELCAATRGRRCRDPGNCATLCCGRGYSTRRATAPAPDAAAAADDARCRCRMLSCCRVRCDVCHRQLDVYICK